MVSNFLNRIAAYAQLLNAIEDSTMVDTNKYSKYENDKKYYSYEKKDLTKKQKKKRTLTKIGKKQRQRNRK